MWSLGCILYYMTYKKTPFQNITNQITKIHAIIDPSHEIDFPDIPEKDLLDVLKVCTFRFLVLNSVHGQFIVQCLTSVHCLFQRCLVRNPRERISIAELLDHPYVQLQPQPPTESGMFLSCNTKRT